MYIREMQTVNNVWYMQVQLNSGVIKGNDERSNFYTGLSWDVFLKLSLFLSTIVKTSANVLSKLRNNCFSLW